MIHFITKKQHKVVPEEGELVIGDEITQEFIDFVTNEPILGVDYEANSLDPFMVDPLLLIIGNAQVQYVFDCVSIDCALVLSYVPADKLVIGANLKYDYKIAKVKHRHTFEKMYDVMIAEQVLLQGMDEYSFEMRKRISLSSALDKIVQRRLGYLPTAMDKAIRKEFIGARADTFVFDNRHITYGAGDIKYLFEIRDKQKEKIAQFDLQFLVYGVEFPCIRELADAELEGFIINEEKWTENIKFNKAEKFKYQCQLDDELRRLRDTLLPKEERAYLSNGVFDRVRQKAVEVVQENLFGDMFFEIDTALPTGKKKSKATIKEPYINWGSTTRLVYIFGRLKQSLPTKSGAYQVPEFVFDAKSKVEKVRKTDDPFTTGEGAIETYLTENPTTPIRHFVELLIKYREFSTRLNTFGENFLIKYKNPVTHKFHTVYRQCHAVTGRLQSGDKDHGWFNSQNIPAEKRFREPFGVAEGYNVCTTDLSGAEAVIMIDKARDEKFYEIAILKDDAHSPLGTAVWRAIGNHRNETWSDTVQKWSRDDRTEISKTPSELATITISKKENKEIRTEFKNTTFASIYGCYPKKYAKMLNISVEEAKIGLNVMKTTIPKTFKMVESNSKFALANGYLILNYRTNRRIWYTEVIESIKNRSEIPFKSASDIGGSARNAPIQGTQADMIKEMMVEIGREIRRQNLDAQLLISVHDELVYKFNNNIQLVEFKNDKTKEVEMITFGDFVKRWMCQVANRYLSFIEMAAEQHIGLTWTK